MWTVRSADRVGVEKPASRADLPDFEVVVVDGFTAETVGRGVEIDVQASDAELAKGEHQTPDGSAAFPHERKYLPWVVGGLAFGGLLIVGIGMFFVGGLEAAAVGLAWVLAGYAVAWIVVWAAGLARAREEAEIEREIVLRDITKKLR